MEHKHFWISYDEQQYLFAIDDKTQNEIGFDYNILFYFFIAQ